MKLHTELNPLVQHLLRIVRSILVHEAERLHVELIVVDSSLDHTVSDSLGNDLFRLLDRLERKLALDIPKANFAVRNVDLLQTELDHSVLQSVHEGHVLVGSEDLGILLQELSKLLHFSLLHTVDDLEVGLKWLLKFLVLEKRPVGDLSHQQLNDNEQLLSLNSEPKGARFGSLSQGLDQAGLGCRVLKLNGFDAANVVQVASELTVIGVFGEGSLRNEVTGLLIEVLLQVRANNDVHQGGLTSGVQVEAARLVGLKDLGSDLGQQTLLLIGDGHEVDGFRLEGVDRASVHQVQSQEDKVTEFLSLDRG